MDQATPFEILAAGLGIFLLFHLSIGFHSLRQRMIGVMGVMGYRTIHSLFAVLALVLIALGYMEREFVPLYSPPEWARWVPVVVMPFSFILLVGAYIAPDLHRVTRHPMLMGVFLWALAHLVANGDQASVMLFGSFAVYAFVAAVLSDRKLAATDPEGARALAAKTSILPMLAILQKRAEPASEGRAVKAMVWGALIYFVIGYAHVYLIGVSALPT